MNTVTIVGQGLAGTLAGLAAERRGWDFVVVDHGSGAPATRAAAGLFNPLTGPRFTADAGVWDRIVPFYRQIEQTLGVALVHPLTLMRPLAGAKAGAETFPRSEAGWSARLETWADQDQVRIEGGGWVDLVPLLEAARNRWRTAGRLEERKFGPEEARDRKVLWCGGVADLTGPVWGPATQGRWQPVRGDVLTVRIERPGLLESLERSDSERLRQTSVDVSPVGHPYFEAVGTGAGRQGDHPGLPLSPIDGGVC